MCKSLKGQCRAKVNNMCTRLSQREKTFGSIIHKCVETIEVVPKLEIKVENNLKHWHRKLSKFTCKISNMVKK